MTNALMSYHVASRSAKALSAALSIRKLTTPVSRSEFDTLICWGYQNDLPRHKKVINSPRAILYVSDKHQFFNTMQKSPLKPRIPEFTTSRQTALEWVKNGDLVFGRLLTRSHSGHGIVFYDEDINDFLKAPLYTKFEKGKWEFRVHVMAGKVIDIQRKALRSDANPELNNRRIKSHENGFVFIRNDISVPGVVTTEALKAMAATNPLLDFGAVDVIYNQHYDRATVLEINSAPGLEGTTLTKYVEAFKDVLK